MSDKPQVTHPHLGHCVVARGYRSGSKIGPLLDMGEGTVWVALKDPPGDDAWWAIPSGARVRVEGTMAQRADLPVFIQREGEPVMQGMPVPEGTDLEQARRRDVIEQATFVLETRIEDVEVQLKKSVGQEVELNGTVVSLNNHWWFIHDGVEVHLDNLEAIPDLQSLHRQAVTLHGRLARRPMPRLDQIVLKPDRDLAEAFVLTVSRLSAHPVWRMERCSE